MTPNNQSDTPMTAEEVANKILIHLGQTGYPKSFDEHVNFIKGLVEQFAAEKVAEDRNKRTADDLYKTSYKRGRAEGYIQGQLDGVKRQRDKDYEAVIRARELALEEANNIVSNFKANIEACASSREDVSDYLDCCDRKLIATCKELEKHIRALKDRKI